MKTSNLFYGFDETEKEDSAFFNPQPPVPLLLLLIAPYLMIQKIQRPPHPTSHQDKNLPEKSMVSSAVFLPNCQYLKFDRLPGV